MNCENIDAPWKVPISNAAENSRNATLEMLKTWESNPEKEIISLSIGDPLSHGNLKPSKETTDAAIQAIKEGKYNGYAPSVGYEDSRKAVSEYLSQNSTQIATKNIILCSGCSNCLDICITVLADGNKGQNILIPKPGFPLYKILAESLRIEARTYELLPDYNWEVDLYDLENKIDQNTAAIIINNPSNPCGSVYSERHLREILDIACSHKVPIIADEIHERMVFSETSFTPITSLSSSVPILLCGGIAKSFLVPGWQLGWIVIHDPIGAFEDVRKGIICLSQRIIGSNTIVQGALSGMMQATPASFNEDVMGTLKESAMVAYDGLKIIDGLKPYMPQGTIYMMVKIDVHKFKFADTLEFVKMLYKEESIFCLPGEVFGTTGFMRIVTSTPPETLQIGIQRINAFCRKYRT